MSTSTHEEDEPQPSTSTAIAVPVSEDRLKDEDESTETKKTTKEEVEKDKPPEPTVPFSCHLCKMTETCDYYGKRPPFARKYQITEDSFIMKDPFSPPPSSSRPNPEYFLVIGTNCTMCGEEVCKGNECSVHYSRTFCRPCALSNIKQFPLEVQTKFLKQLKKDQS